VGQIQFLAPPGELALAPLRSRTVTLEGVSYSTVCNYVAWRRPQIMAEAGRGSPREVPIDQVHRPGVEADVDFADVWINLAGTMTNCYLFVFRLSYSGKAVHRVGGLRSAKPTPTPRAPGR
jgi:hypothetical protein